MNEFDNFRRMSVVSKSVLVTGAAGGTLGKTGRHVAEGLLKRGVAVRAFVRVDDERAAALTALGAQVVVRDLREVRDIEPALDRVERVFFTYPAIEQGTGRPRPE